ncbi:MAG TPA: class I SAM-dependent methyltransferase [Gaiellaceae bacterium]|nr:class I SAM-dependent methyltransferase [Gaiellaceae bacterium]
MSTLRDRLNALDVTLMEHTVSQMLVADKRSVLALHAAIADRLGHFTYLEIGSYKGGSLQALVADERCRKIISIDPRPEWVADDRSELASGGWVYSDNTTQGMLDGLATIPGADVSKVEAIELGTDEIDPAGVDRPDICFVDGEHTHDAVLRDARFCRAAMRGSGVVAFHDFAIVPGAILEFVRESHPAFGYLLRHETFVVELGTPTLFSDARVKRQLRLPSPAWPLLNRLHGLRLLADARRLRRRFR